MTIQMYKTKDFYLAGYILSMGHEMKSYERNNGVTTFSFGNNNQLQNHVTQFYSQQARVNPVLFGNSLRNLKAIIYADGNSHVTSKTQIS